MKKSQHIIRKKRRRSVVLLLFFLAAALVVGLSVFLIIFSATEVPNIDSFSEREVAESTKIYDRTGKILLWEIHGEERRTVVPLYAMSRYIKNATVAIEDSSFYEHRGVSVLAIIRALIVDIMSGKKVQGGSTITQQLVKNALLTPERTVTRKIKEAIMAVKLERRYSKDDILEFYLNEIPYGSNAYGIESAARIFFGKKSGDLSLAEAAYLAALPRSTTYYSPYGNNKKQLDQRKNFILERMERLGFITKKEREAAEQEKVAFRPPSDRNIRAPHFVMYVRKLLSEMYDEHFIERAGLTVITTIDMDMQTKAEEVVARYAESNEKQFNATNAGIVAINPKTGEILAMVGSRDYFDISREGNFNVILAHRQPGSAFKPIVYVTAFQRGYTPDTVVFDLKTEFSAKGAKESYMPQNYDAVFRGPITLRNALAQSVNIPSVKVLYLVGVKNALKTARSLGITSLNDMSRYGLSLVLGGGEVSPLELTSAYGTFAADGLHSVHNAIKKITKPDGSVLFRHTPEKKRVLDEQSVRTLNNVLSDNEARTPAFGARSPLYFPNHSVAAKTGTTNNYRDAWTVGYNPNIVVGAWAGNNDNSPIKKKIAGFVVTPLWKEFMDFALTRVKNDEFPKPKKEDPPKKPVLRGEWRGSETYTIDTISKKLATEFTPEELRKEKVKASVHNILYWVSKNNPRGDIPQTPEQDSQFNNWEIPVREWVKEKNIYEDDANSIPTEFDDVHGPKFAPHVLIQNGTSETYTTKDNMVLQLAITSKFQIKQIDVFLNGEFVRSQKSGFQKVRIPLSNADPYLEKNVLLLRVYDKVGNQSDIRRTITVEYL